MEHTITISLPDEVVRPLNEIARSEGKTLEQIAVEKISSSVAPQQFKPISERERKEALDQLLRHAGAVSSGNPRSADNEQIDADLAREYGKDI